MHTDGIRAEVITHGTVHLGEVTAVKRPKVE